MTDPSYTLHLPAAASHQAVKAAWTAFCETEPTEEQLAQPRWGRPWQITRTDRTFTVWSGKLVRRVSAVLLDLGEPMPFAVATQPTGTTRWASLTRWHPDLGAHCSSVSSDGEPIITGSAVRAAISSGECVEELTAELGLAWPTLTEIGLWTPKAVHA